MWNGCCIQPFHHHFIFEAFQKKDFVKRTKNPSYNCIVCIWQVPHLTFLPNIVKSSMLTKGLDLLCDICPYGLKAGLTVTFSRIKSNSQQNFSCKAAYFSLAWIKTLGYSDLFFQRIVGMHEMPTLRTKDYTRTSKYILTKNTDVLSEKSAFEWNFRYTRLQRNVFYFKTVGMCQKNVNREDLT